MKLEHDTKINMNIVKMCIDKFCDIRISSSINFTVIRFRRYVCDSKDMNVCVLCDIEVSYSGLTDLYDLSIYMDGKLVFKVSDKQAIDMIGVIWDLSYSHDQLNIERSGEQS